MWSGNLWSSASLLVYNTIIKGFAMLTSSSLTRTWSAFTCWSLGMAPCDPWLICFPAKSNWYIFNLIGDSLFQQFHIYSLSGKQKPAKGSWLFQLQISFPKSKPFVAHPHAELFNQFGKRYAESNEEGDIDVTSRNPWLGLWEVSNQLSISSGRSSGVLISGGRSSIDS